MRLIVLACAGAVAIAFGAESVVAQTQPKDVPPKEKPQLNEKEKALLHWWIESGASFDKKVKELTQPEKIKPVLLSLQQAVVPDIVIIPEKPVTPADTVAIAALVKRGIVVSPMVSNSNYLQANFFAVDNISDKDIALLIPLKKQLLSLRLSNAPITDEGLKAVSQCTEIVRLYLDHTKITDQGIVVLQSLINLQYLNLVGTRITAQGLMSLKQLNKLHSIYLYQAAIKKEEWGLLKTIFPKTLIDSGGYTVPTLESDTTEKKDTRK